MKKAIFILIVLSFSFLYYTGLLTWKETPIFLKDFFLIESPTSTDRVWNLEKGSPLNTKELEQLYQLKLDRGFQNIPTLSFFLIREAEQARKKGNFIQAIELATYSIKFSPQLSQPYFELAQAYWEQNPFQLYKILFQMIRGGIAPFRHYPSSLKLIFNTFYILSSAILMTFLIFGIVVMIKYLPLYFYDIQKNMTQEILSLLFNGLKILLLLVPFLFRLDILWAILFWSILLWGYVMERERQLILVFLIILVYLPFFLRTASSFLDGPSSEVILEISKANQEEPDRTTEEKLQNWLSTHPDDPEVLFSLGLIEKRQGHYPQAEELYKRVILNDPQFSEPYSNMGNLYLTQQQTNLAISSYQQAIQLNPKKGAYFFNLYRAYSQETFLSEKADQAFQRARQLAPDLVNEYLNIESPNINRLVVDEVLAAQRLWGRGLTDLIGREGILFLLFKAWFERIPSRVPFLMPFLFLGYLIGMFRYSRAKRFLTRCPWCGIPTYRFYMGTLNQEFVCFKCYHIFIQKKKLHPMIIENKSREARQFQKVDYFIGRFLSFFFCGFGYLWRDHTIKGMIFLFLFFIFVLKFLHWNGVIPSSIMQPTSAYWSKICWGGLFILFYIYSIRKMIRLKPTFEGESINNRGPVLPAQTFSP